VIKHLKLCVKDCDKYNARIAQVQIPFVLLYFLSPVNPSCFSSDSVAMPLKNLAVALTRTKISLGYTRRLLFQKKREAAQL
jgi:hypothetical protein